MEAAADTAGDVGQDVECIAEYAVSVEQDAVDGAAVVDAVAVDAAEVGAAAADAVANDAAGDVAVAAASLVYAAVKKILSATKVCIKKKYLLSHLPLSPQNNNQQRTFSFG